VAAAVAIASVTGVWLPAPAAGQVDAGLLAKGADREIDVSYDASANRTDVRLTLAPAVNGTAPAVTLVFTGQFAGRTLGSAPTRLAVRTHITPRSDPRTRDPRTGAEGRDLIFHLDPETGSGITLYLYATSFGYPGFVAPGDEVTVAFFDFRPAELRAMSVARSVSGRALGSDFTLAADQLDAVREFTRRVVP
jgi:hypothetical protein